MIKKRGQSLVEYGIFIGVIGAALITMSVYLRRSINAVVKTAADEMGDQRQGMVEHTPGVRFIRVEPQEVETTSQGANTKETFIGGEVSYEKNERSTKTGTPSSTVSYEEE